MVVVGLALGCYGCRAAHVCQFGYFYDTHRRVHKGIFHALNMIVISLEPYMHDLVMERVNMVFSRCYFVSFTSIGKAQGYRQCDVPFLQLPLDFIVPPPSVLP